MALFTVKSTIDKGRTSARLKVIGKGLKDYSKPLKKAGEELTKNFFGKKVFDSQGAALGTKWKALAATTAVARAKGYGHYKKGAKSRNKILVWTGALSKGFVDKIKKFSLSITNKVFYFKFNNPTRTMLAINDKVIKIVVKQINKYLKSLTK